MKGKSNKRAHMSQMGNGHSSVFRVMWGIWNPAIQQVLYRMKIQEKSLKLNSGTVSTR